MIVTETRYIIPICYHQLSADESRKPLCDKWCDNPTQVLQTWLLLYLQDYVIHSQNIASSIDNAKNKMIRKVNIISNSICILYLSEEYRHFDNNKRVTHLCVHWCCMCPFANPCESSKYLLCHTSRLINFWNSGNMTPLSIRKNRFFQQVTP